MSDTICYYDDEGNIYKESYHSNGAIIYENYYTNGKLYRQGLPSHIIYNIYSDVSLFMFTNTEGEPHKTDGPALIRYDANGNIIRLDWYYKTKGYTSKVHEWLENNCKSVECMTKDDYDRMWFEIL